MKTNKEYIKVNKRLHRIKDMGLTPITLKSPSDIAQKIVYQKGTGNEGLIMSYKEASFMAQNDRNETLTIEEYNKSVETFMREYSEQTYVEGALDQAIERAKGTLHYIQENIGEFNPEIDIDSLSKREIIDMLQYAGNQMNELKQLSKSNYRYDNSPEAYLQFIDQWYSEHKGE